MVCFPRYGRWTHDLHLYYCRAVVRIHIYISGIKTLSHIYRMRTIVLEALPGRPTVSRLPHPQCSIVQQNLISFYYLHYSKLKTNLHRKNITATKYKLNITDIHHTCFVFFLSSNTDFLHHGANTPEFLLQNRWRARAFTGGEPGQPGPIAALPATSATARTLLALPHVTSPCTACAAPDSLVRAQTRSLVCFGSAFPGLCQHCKAGAAAQFIYRVVLPPCQDSPL